LDQAVECGVQRVDLHPSNILLRVGKNGPLLARELDRLMQKRLDAWPAFVVKLRPHMTMRSLYEPLLVDMDITEDQVQEEHLQDRDFRYRSFVALAGYLLTGERQSGGVPQFPESVPDAAATYVRECLELTRRAGKTPSPGDFIDKFEGLLSAPVVDLATRLRGNAVAMEEMESAGSVSDFEDDWTEHASGAGDFEDDGVSANKLGIKAHDFSPLLNQKRGTPWGALAAAAVVILGVGIWLLVGGKDKDVPVAESALPSSEAEGPATIKTVMEQVNDRPVVMQKTIKVEQPNPKSEQTTASKPQVSSPKGTPAKPAGGIAVAVPNPDRQQALTAPVSPVKPEVKEPKQAAIAVTDVVTPSSAPEKPVVPAQPAPAVKPPEKDPITIRRAILPSKEEIDRMKQGQVENSTGQLPVMSTASPLLPQRKEKP
jgi:hypothetical protein